MTVSGLAATVELLQPQGDDRLDVDTLGGTDAVDTGGLDLGAVQLFVDGSPLPKP